MARSPPRRSSTILPPVSAETDSHTWNDKEENISNQHHQYYTMPSNSHFRYEAPRQHIPARLHKSPPTDTAKESMVYSNSGKQEDTQPASRAMVIFSVLFYLVAALVMVSRQD